MGLRTYNVEARKHMLERLPEIVDALCQSVARRVYDGYHVQLSLYLYR